MTTVDTVHSIEAAAPRPSIWQQTPHNPCHGSPTRHRPKDVPYRRDRDTSRLWPDWIARRGLRAMESGVLGHRQAFASRRPLAAVILFESLRVSGV